MYMQAPGQAPPLTLGQWLAQQTWEPIAELEGTNSRQKAPSQQEEYAYQYFDRVERQADLSFMTLHQGWVNQLLARTDIVPQVASVWAGTRGRQLAYRAESELENHLASLWNALNDGIPADAETLYPSQITNMPWKRRDVIGGYSGGGIKGIKFDIAARFQTGRELGDPDTRDTVYLLVEVKNERAIQAKVRDLEARIQQSVMPHAELSKLTEADQMLVQCYTQAKVTGCEVVVLMGHNSVYLLQAVASELFIHGPLYRYPVANQPAFTPLYAMRVLASAFRHRAYLHHVNHLSVEPDSALEAAIVRTPTNHLLSMFRPAHGLRLLRALRRLWDEMRLATCRSLHVRYPNGRVVIYNRSKPALTGRVVCWALFPFFQWLGHHVFRTVTLNVTQCLDGGQSTFAWRGTVGATSVVIKTDLNFNDDWTEREVTTEWDRLAFALPRDPQVASTLPIPAYYGLFVGARASIILMSDCGDPINHYPDLEERLHDAQTEALAAMENAGIQVQDVADRNTVYDGARVRIIDFV